LSWAAPMLAPASAPGICFWNCSASLRRLSKLSGPASKELPNETYCYKGTCSVHSWCYSSSTKTFHQKYRE
jgi:hypothetical protein